MADPQDEIVANFTTLVTTNTTALVATILAYHQPLVNSLFSCVTLDQAHRDQIRNVDKSALRVLRARLDTLATTIGQAQQTGDL